MNTAVKKYLESMAPLSCFWTYNYALIHYWSDGQAWTIMDDDESRVDDCLEFLLSISCPNFHDRASMIEHIAALAAAKK
jgi:hypothetical protein